MRLKQVTVTNYRCINDSGPFEIGDVTCLVGKNESGKTAALQAMRKLNSVEGPSLYDDVMDYPAKSFALYKKVRDKQPAEVVTAVFELDDDEVARIERDFGAGVLRERTFPVTKHYPPGGTTFGVRVNEAAAVRHLTEGVVLPEGRGKSIRKIKRIDQLVEALDAIEASDPSVTALRQQIASWRDERLVLKLIDDYLGTGKGLPRFFFFDSYSVLEGKVSIPELRRRREAGELQDADRTMLALLSMVGARLDDFEDASNYERLKRELEAAANSITDQVFQYWTQNKQLAVALDIASPETGAQPPLDQGPILHVRIHNQRHRVTVPFDERSRGFVWFFSFLAYFSELEAGSDGRDIILLLDEPGLNLHATAQRDLLRFIDERLAPRHQVVYTTHSPFMIQADRLARVRTVQDVDGEGTKISAEVFRTDSETVFPLQAALGLDLAQTLFVGPDCLLVEGPSDLLYIQLLNQALAAKAMATLDPRWVVVPVGGADKLVTFVSLLGANQLNVAVLMDISGNSMQRIKNLQANAKLRANALVQISEVTSANDADIEDLFDPGFYLELVNGAYQDKLARPLALADLPQGNPRIVRRLEQHFRDNDIAGGKFSHYPPAAYFLQEQATLLPGLDRAILERAEKLFRRVNELLRA
jgi:AAA domain, putative AbiEii toxin, Type IV TA system/AAA ATPase domain